MENIIRSTEMTLALRPLLPIVLPIHTVTHLSQPTPVWRLGGSGFLENIREKANLVAA